MTGWTQPENLAFLEIKGPDAVRFLNGQVTNDVSVDLSGKVITACVCGMKGKIEAIVRVTEGFNDDSLLIETTTEQAESVFNRLDRYLIADDCEFSDTVSVPKVTHVISDEAPSGDAREHWRYGLKGYDVFGEIDLTGEAIPNTDLATQTALHGIPEFGYEITGEEFPASLGLDKWAVDFHKGCYLGQEIVSRIESAGKIPRKLRLYTTAAPYTKGTEFENDSGKTNATVVRDSIPNGEQYLTSLLAKNDFEKEGFTEVEIQYPPKL